MDLSPHLAMANKLAAKASLNPAVQSNQGVLQSIVNINNDLTVVKQDIAQCKQEIDRVKSELAGLESTLGQLDMKIGNMQSQVISGLSESTEKAIEIHDRLEKMEMMYHKLKELFSAEN